MENAVDALKIAFAVIVFVMALSISIYMFSAARETADLVLHSSDETEYMEYEEAVAGTENRVVGLETIVPTLYKYYKENYTVIFRNTNGTYMKLYETQTNMDLWSTGYINRYYNDNKSTVICSFDVDEETRRHEPWTGGTDYYKQNLDAFLSGRRFDYPSGSGESYNYAEIIGKGGFMAKYKNSKFIENLGEYTYSSKTNDDDNIGNEKEKKKRVIVYTLQN